MDDHVWNIPGKMDTLKLCACYRRPGREAFTLARTCPEIFNKIKRYIER